MSKIIFWCLFVLAVGYRFWLWDIFAGWEESDYGNIAMIRGVYESGFRSYDMNHMPGYYGLAALVLFFCDDAVLAGKLASTIGGSLSLLGISLLMQRMVGWGAATLLVLVLSLQPEFSLYSASALREPVYTMFLMGMIFFVLEKEWLLAGFCAAFAFGVRFEFPLVILPLIFLMWFRYGFSSIASLSIPIIGAIFLWMLYCIEVYDTPAFWAHAASTNIDTGMGAEALGRWEWFSHGTSIVYELLFALLPNRVGWIIWFGWVVAAWLVPKTSKVWLILALSYGLVGVWLLIAFIAQHEPNHNLYWKWLYPLIPVVSFCGIWGLWFVLVNQNFRIQVCAWVVIIAMTNWGHIQEAQAQIQRAQILYAPQIQLAEYIEKHAPKERLLLVDNIPACWINRKVHDYRLISWFDIPVSQSNPTEFAAWLIKEDVWGVLWFREEWTMAPVKASFLSNGGTWMQNGYRLKEISREDEYGWIFFVQEEVVSP